MFDTKEKNEYRVHINALSITESPPNELSNMLTQNSGSLEHPLLGTPLEPPSRLIKKCLKKNVSTR